MGKLCALLSGWDRPAGRCSGSRRSLVEPEELEELEELAAVLNTAAASSSIHPSIQAV